MKTEHILAAIFAALKGQAAYFTITPGEILVKEDDQFFQLFEFTPRQMDLEDTRVIGRTQFLEFGITEGEECLVVGEDTEIQISFGNIYASLYWGQATESISEPAPGNAMENRA